MTIHILTHWPIDDAETLSFDTSINETQLLLSQGHDISLIIQAYVPKLRALLHENDSARAHYWSAFDTIQQIKLTQPQPLSLSDFSWPPYAQFTYLRDRILIDVNDEHYATAWLTSPNLSELDYIDLFVNQELNQQIMIDDRGFISRINHYNSYQVKRTDFLTPSGQIAMQITYDNNQLQDIHTAQEWENQQHFSNLDTLLNIVTRQYLAHLSSEDTVIVTQSNHNDQLIPYLSQQNIIYTLYTVPDQLPDNVQQFITHDTNVYNTLDKSINKKLTYIPLYATQFHLSQQAKFKTIYWLNEDLSFEEQELVLVQLMALAYQHLDLTVIIESPLPAKMITDMILNVNQQVSDDDSQRQDYLNRFLVLPKQRRTQRQHFMRSAYLLLDLGQTPNEFLQVTALDDHIPQIVRQTTPYLSPDKNGKVIDNLQDVSAAVTFYLDNMDNWQFATAQSDRISDIYNTTKLGQQWQTLLNTRHNEEHDAK